MYTAKWELRQCFASLKSSWVGFCSLTHFYDSTKLYDVTASNEFKLSNARVPKDKREISKKAVSHT